MKFTEICNDEKCRHIIERDLLIMRTYCALVREFSGLVRTTECKKNDGQCAEGRRLS